MSLQWIIAVSKRMRLALASLFFAAAAAAADPTSAQVIVNQTITLQVEIAATMAQRQHGLSERAAIAADGGMLFLFDEPRRVCLWMKNTHFPLIAVFVGINGNILKTTVMQPHDEKLHCANNTAWVLEMRDDVVSDIRQLSVIYAR